MGWWNSTNDGGGRLRWGTSKDGRTEDFLRTSGCPPEVPELMNFQVFSSLKKTYHVASSKWGVGLRLP